MGKSKKLTKKDKEKLLKGIEEESSKYLFSSKNLQKKSGK